MMNILETIFEEQESMQLKEYINKYPSVGEELFHYLEEDEEIYILTRLERIDQCSFNEVEPHGFHTVWFTTNRPVGLISFGFYGPYDEINHPAADYEISIQLSKSKSRRYIGKTTCQVVAESRKIFHIGFGKPIQIQKGICYELHYEIKGPPTCRCTKRKHIVTNQYGDNSFTFQFNGFAWQLPQICFVKT